MAKLPKDYSRHENKILFGLSINGLMTLVTIAAIVFFVYKLEFIPIIIKAPILAILVVIGLFCVFYKTEDGDDFITYLFALLSYYSSPKYLVYNKQLPERSTDVNGQKNR